jgi:hydroxymethylbilane synthase
VLVRIGSRGSRLALVQAEQAATALRGLGHEVAFLPITTAGDRERSSPFGQIGERGVFVKEIEEALLAGRIDVAVHSAKDMTSTDTDGLAVGAYLERDDPRDALIGAAGIRPGMRIGTASVRRRAQLLAVEPSLSVEPLRGNVDTRLRKARERGLDALVLAACGLDRLGLALEIGFRVPIDVMLPEVGQGFLALQTRASEASLLARVNDEEGLRVLRAERAAAGTFGGGCLAPVAAHAEPRASGALHLLVWIGLPDGSVSASASGEGDDPEALGRAVAEQALDAGGRPLLEASRV